MQSISILVIIYTACLILPSSLAFNSIDCRTHRVNRLELRAADDGGTSVQRPPPRRSLKKVCISCAVGTTYFLHLIVARALPSTIMYPQRKNKRRERMDRLFRNTQNEPIQEDEYEIETRPVRRSDAIEAGLDYWMDEVDLEKERQRKIAVKNRKVC